MTGLETALSAILGFSFRTGATGRAGGNISRRSLRAAEPKTPFRAAPGGRASPGPHVARRFGNLSWLAASLALGLARAVHAAEGDIRVDGTLGAAWLRGAGWGPSAAVHVEVGMNETLSGTFGGRVSVLGKHAAFASDASVGLKARFDVLRWVPYAGISVGVCRCVAASPSASPLSKGYSATLRAGVEYLLSRGLSARLGGAYSQIGNDDWAPWLVFSGGLAWHSSW